MTETNQKRSILEVDIQSPISGINADKQEINASDIIECYIIEDIFAYCLTGKLIFNDVNGLLDVGGLIAGTFVWIRYGDGIINDSDNNAMTLIPFIIHRINKITPKIPNKQKDMSNANLIELSLVEPHFNRLIGQTYSRSWDKKTSIEDMIKTILEKMVGWDAIKIVLDGDDVKNTDSFISNGFTIPYWTPLQTLNFLMDRFGDNGICCYSSIDWSNEDKEIEGWKRWGAIINIKSLNDMLKQTELLNDPGKGIYKIDSALLYDYNKILSYQIDGTDMFNNRQLRGGGYLGYNFDKKKIINEKFQYSLSGNGNNTLADKITTLGKWTLLQGTEQKESLNTQNEELYDVLIDSRTKNILTGETDKDIIMKIVQNNFIKSYCMQNTMSIIVKGHESRRCGKMIEIQWPPTDSTTSSYNPNLHGNYLIKSVTHHWATENKPFYKNKLVLIKNSYNYNGINSDILYESQDQNIKKQTNNIVSK